MDKELLFMYFGVFTRGGVDRVPVLNHRRTKKKGSFNQM